MRPNIKFTAANDFFNTELWNSLRSLASLKPLEFHNLDEHFLWIGLPPNLEYFEVGVFALACGRDPGETAKLISNLRAAHPNVEFSLSHRIYINIVDSSPEGDVKAYVEDLNAWLEVPGFKLAVADYRPGVLKTLMDAGLKMDESKVVSI